MNNGGFHQYFYNSSGDHALVALQSLEAIGATQIKDLLEQAIKIAFDGDMPLIWEKRQKKLLDLDKSGEQKLSQLDDEFYKYNENLEKKINAYLNKK